LKFIDKKNIEILIFIEKNLVKKQR